MTRFPTMIGPPATVQVLASTDAAVATPTTSAPTSSPTTTTQTIGRSTQRAFPLLPLPAISLPTQATYLARPATDSPRLQLPPSAREPQANKPSSSPDRRHHRDPSSVVPHATLPRALAHNQALAYAIQPDSEAVQTPHSPEPLKPTRFVKELHLVDERSIIHEEQGRNRQQDDEEQETKKAGEATAEAEAEPEAEAQAEVVASTSTTTEELTKKSKRGKRKRQWSAEEKKTRRKLQCRMNQRRYRARQRGLTMVLTLETRRLHDHVQELEWYLQFLRDVEKPQPVPTELHADSNRNRNRNQLPRAIRVVHEFFRLFEYGFAHESQETSEIQSWFLEFIMDQQVTTQGAKENGLEAFVLQLKRYTSYHASFRMCIESLETGPQVLVHGAAGSSPTQLAQCAGFGRHGKRCECVLTTDAEGDSENTPPKALIGSDNSEEGADQVQGVLDNNDKVTAPNSSKSDHYDTSIPAVVYVRGRLFLRISRDTILLVFPHVMENEALCDELVGHEVSPCFTMGFHFNAHGKVSKLDFFVDFTTAFLTLFKDADKVQLLMEQAQISQFSELGLGQVNPLEKATSEQLKLKYILL